MKTDTQLQQDVSAELRWEPSIHATEIGVAVKDGAVTLSGEVGSYSEKLSAERAAQRVSGVKGLAIDMKVKIPGWSIRSDTDIARSAEQTLEWTTFLPVDSIKVTVEHGWVTLSGKADWTYQKTAAIKAVHHLLGVTGVSDQIVVKNSVSSSSIKSDIEAALKRRAAADAKTVSVDVDGSTVTLHGNIHSWSEREMAKQSAWNSQGVYNVVDKMVIVN
jgi:osmotically-inducible protein OsmY